METVGASEAAVGSLVAALPYKAQRDQLCHLAMSQRSWHISARRDLLSSSLHFNHVPGGAILALALGPPFLCWGSEGEGIDSMCQGDGRAGLLSTPSYEGDLSLAPCCSLHACCLGKGRSLCLKAL